MNFGVSWSPWLSGGSRPAHPQQASSHKRDQLRRALSECPVREHVRLEQRTQCVAEQEIVVTVVESPSELIEVRVKVLDAEMVVRAEDAALEQAPGRLDGVGVNVAAHPFLFQMIDGFVNGVGV